MSWRTIVIQRRAKLEYRLGQMIIRREELQKVNLNEVNEIIVESTAVSLTTSLLSEIIKRKIKIIFCDEEHNPISELVGLRDNFQSSGRIREQIKWPQEIKQIIAREIIFEKIRNQIKLLESLNKRDAKSLETLLSKLDIGDTSNCEAQAARIYFLSLFGDGFTRSQDSNVNAALNYGYSILLSAFNREVASCGYLTQLGLFHDSQTNPFNLSSDLMEPFRVIVDAEVYYHLDGLFNKEMKYKLISLLEKEYVIDGRSQHLNYAIKIYVNSIFAAINERDISKIKFFNYEL